MSLFILISLRWNKMTKRVDVLLQLYWNQLRKMSILNCHSLSYSCFDGFGIFSCTFCLERQHPKNESIETNTNWEEITLFALLMTILDLRWKIVSLINEIPERKSPSAFENFNILQVYKTVNESFFMQFCQSTEHILNDEVSSAPMQHSFS